MTEFSMNLLKLILAIPRGRVITYGQLALLAGNPRAARQVSRFLHSASDKYKLAWHRVINSRGEISLTEGEGRELQIQALEQEGIEFDSKGRIDLERYGWNGP